MFLRLIECGPSYPDDPKMLVSDGKTILSDPECGQCVQLIYSRMVNKFKGELGELLALGPCISLVKSLQSKGHLPPVIDIFWGGMIKQPKEKKKGRNIFAEGADGLIVEKFSCRNEREDALRIHGIVEIKSFRSFKPVLKQIAKHKRRLKLGLKLGQTEYSKDAVFVNEPNLLRIIVVPSLSRDLNIFRSFNEKHTRNHPKSDGAPDNTTITKIERDTWVVNLAWSREAIDEAAHEMTFWYMGQVGKKVYARKKMPDEWEGMTHEEAGRNNTKIMLYSMLLRLLKSEHEALVTKFYNIYGFGYTLGMKYYERDQMIWSQKGKLEGLKTFERPKKEKKKKTLPT